MKPTKARAIVSARPIATLIPFRSRDRTEHPPARQPIDGRHAYFATTNGRRWGR